MTLSKIVVIITVLIGFKTAAFAQNEDSSAVALVVNTLFDGMREGDSSKVANTFHPHVKMLTTYIQKDGEAGMQEGKAQEFLTAVGTPHDLIWDERIANLHIQVDDNLAQVWMDYSFYVSNQFSHCGVNAMQLVKLDDRWMIVHLMDTRRKGNCGIE